ncbi:MAG: alpha-galactosidase [Bifidobacteriaceae bacterium]|nr:alpha-galactosidase [Bifidobacteriaceae bacterium]
MSISQYSTVSSSDVKLRTYYCEQTQSNVGVVVSIINNELPRIVYWGKALKHSESSVNLVDGLQPQRVSGALDNTAWPSILPTQSESWIGEPRLQVDADGVELFCKFSVKDVEVDTENTVLRVIAHDEEENVELVWEFELENSGLIRQRAALRNLGTHVLGVHTVELGFPVPANATEILTTTGHHLRERSPQRQALQVGRFEKVTTVGRPDFDASLLLSVGQSGFGFEHGEVYSTHVAWSGNAVLSVERLPYTQGVIGGGEKLYAGEIVLHPGSQDEYKTPWVYGSYGYGLNQVAQRFHEHIREVHARRREALGLKRKSRPVILNTWEAVYFNHDYDTLVALADKAAQSGVERFVVDDGWFGSRRDDTSGLGDWQISQDVWPDGEKSLQSLAQYVHGKGMEFGLWFEPEMINPDSDTFRAHPDWVLKPAHNRLPMQGRSQQVIDLTNPQAYEYVYNAMTTLVEQLGIDYIKWDHNKMVTEEFSPYNNRPATHAQTLALYKIITGLKTQFPGLEIESCASGGARVDLGILEITDRIWASDCVDPVERADIQRYTSLLVPPEMIGEHVGASPAHSTHRATSQEMRMATSFFGHMGIEWNLLQEPQENIDKLGVWVQSYKRYRDEFASGIVVHGDAQDSAVRVDGVLNQQRSHGIYRFTQLTTSQTYPAAPIQIPGLDPYAVYHVKPLNINEDLSASNIANGQSSLGWWNSEGVKVEGEVLRTFGIRPPSLHPAQAVLFEVTLVQE